MWMFWKSVIFLYQEAVGYKERGGLKMKVKYVGKAEDPLSVIKGHIYECLGIEKGWYRIIDETEEDYLYPPDDFVIVEE